MSTEAVRVLVVTIISFITALAVTPLAMRIILKLNMRKQIRVSPETPIFSKLHQAKEGTPTMGGVIIWGTVLVLALVFWILNHLFDGFFGYLDFVNRAGTYLPIAALIIGAVLGLLDDTLGALRIGPKGGGLTVSKKLIVYFLISAVGAWWFYSPRILDWHILHVPFFGNFDIGAWYIPLFMFIIVASAFSANETDGLDGLFGGVSLFAFSALSVIAFSLGRFDLSAMSAAIVGALLAFLWFNIHPAKFFMGDTGSMALGITIGVTAMLTNTALLLPLFFIIPVIESATVIMQVISKKLFKKKIFLSTPIHHHFEALGWPESQITMRFWIISIVSTGLGLALFFMDKFLF